MGAGPPLTDTVKMTLCTGSPGGNYYQVGAEMRNLLAPVNVSLEAISTKGSQENLRRIRDGSCDAGIVQHDAYFLEIYGVSKESDRLRVQRPRYLFDEYVHVVCNHNSGVRRLSDLLKEPARQRLLIGDPESGSAVTWEVFTELDPEYKSVPTEPVGGDAAMNLVARNEGPACFLYVASLNTPFMGGANELGDAMVLVIVDDGDLNNARIAGEKIYRFDRIPEGTYPRLQVPGERPDVRTLTVGSSVIVGESWAERHPQAYRQVLQSIADARRNFANWCVRR